MIDVLESKYRSKHVKVVELFILSLIGEYEIEGYSDNNKICFTYEHLSDFAYELFYEYKFNDSERAYSKDLLVDELVIKEAFKNLKLNFKRNIYNEYICVYKKGND